MSPVYFVSGNLGKGTTITAAAQRYGVAVVHHRPTPKLREIQDDSYAEVARDKVRQAVCQVKPAFCIDGGVGVESLNGWPGTMTEPTFRKLTVEQFLWLVGQTGNYRATFGNALAYWDDRLREPIVFEDVIPGTLIVQGRGEADPKVAWSLLWRHFVPDGASMTFAELDKRPEVQEAWREWRGVQNTLNGQFFTWLLEHQAAVGESG